MDAVSILIVVALGCLAGCLTLLVARELRRANTGDAFAASLKAMTETERFAEDLSGVGVRARTWNEFWLSLFRESGRDVVDPAAPGRLVLTLGIVALFFGVVVFPGGPAGVIVPGATLLAVLLWAARGRAKRRALTDAQLPLLLSSMRAQLQAGKTVQGALLSLADDFKAPLGYELRRVKGDVSVSIPFKDALAGMADRTQSKLVKFLVSSIGIAIKSGSDLIPQLVLIEKIVQQRRRIQGEIKSAIATAKPTAYIAMGAPVALAGYLLFTDPTFGAFYVTPMGLITLGICAVFYAAGAFTIMVMVSNVEKV